MNFLPKKNEKITHISWSWAATLFFWQFSFSIIIALIVEFLPIKLNYGVWTCLLGSLVASQQMGMFLKRRCPSSLNKKIFLEFSLKNSLLVALASIAIIVSCYLFDLRIIEIKPADNPLIICIMALSISVTINFVATLLGLFQGAKIQSNL